MYSLRIRYFSTYFLRRSLINWNALSFSWPNLREKILSLPLFLSIQPQEPTAWLNYEKYERNTELWTTRNLASNLTAIPWEFEVGTKAFYMRPLILGEVRRTDRCEGYIAEIFAMSCVTLFISENSNQKYLSRFWRQVRCQDMNFRSRDQNSLYELV